MSNNTNASHKSYSCDDLINEIGIIVDNSYIVFHNECNIPTKNRNTDGH